MKLLDRYILRRFIINFVILMIVLMVLFITIDMLTDLDEFLKAGAANAPEFGGTFVGVLYVMADYYGPLSILLYAFFSGLLVVAAMAFTFSDLQKTHELTAIVAGGVSLYRVAAPVILVGIALNALVLPAQEFLIPDLAGKLLRSKSQVGQETIGGFSINLVPDGKGNLFSAASFNVQHKKLKDLTIIQRNAKGIATRRITAVQATWNAKKDGWNLIQGYSVSPQVSNFYNKASQSNNQTTAPQSHFAPHPESIHFFKTDLTPTILVARQNSSYANFLSISKLKNLSTNKALSANERGRIAQILWSRFSLLVLNVLILVMALPYFLTRFPDNLLKQSIKAACLVLGAWGGGLVLLQVHTGLVNPVVSVWLPVVIYLPVSAIMLQFMKT